MKRLVFLITLVILTISCKKKKESKEPIAKKPAMSVAVKHPISNKLTSDSEEKIKNWKEHKNVASFLKRLENTSPNEALNNAVELKNLVRQLKDSIRIEELKTPAFKARVNVLQNEAMRLADMVDIQAITPKEVNAQVDKIMSVFSNLNAKITAFYNEDKLNKELDMKDFLTLDTKEKKPKHRIERSID